MQELISGLRGRAANLRKLAGMHGYDCECLLDIEMDEEAVTEAEDAAHDANFALDLEQAADALEQLTRRDQTLMEEFKLHWRDGVVQIVHGHTIADAFQRAGLGHGSIAALDYWEEL